MSIMVPTRSLRALQVAWHHQRVWQFGVERAWSTLSTSFPSVERILCFSEKVSGGLLYEALQLGLVHDSSWIQSTQGEVLVRSASHPVPSKFPNVFPSSATFGL